MSPQQQVVGSGADTTSEDRETQPSSERPVLVFDHNAELLQDTVSKLRDRFGEDSALGTTNPMLVVNWVEELDPALLVMCVSSEEMTELEILRRARSTIPQLQVVVTASFQNAEIQLGAERGVFRFLPRPHPFSSLEALVRDIASEAGEKAMGGSIAALSVAELVQLFTANERKGCLKFSDNAGLQAGVVCIDGEFVTHAQTSTRRGPAAFHEICSWKHGDFEWVRDAAMDTSMRERAIDLLLSAPGASTSRDNATDKVPDDVRETQPVVKKRTRQSASEFDTNLAPTSRSREDIRVPTHFNELENISGFIAAAAVRLGQETAVATLVGDADFDIEVAARANQAVVSAKLRAVDALDLDDQIHDILITLPEQYHLIRPLDKTPDIFLYLALERAEANLALARLALELAGQHIEPERL